MRYDARMTLAVSVAANPAAPCADLPRVAWRVALLSILGFWLFYFALNTGRAALEGAAGQWSMVERRTAVSLLGMGLTLLYCLVLRRVEQRSIAVLVWTAFLVGLPVSIAYAAINYTAFYVIAPADKDLQEVACEGGRIWGPVAIVADSASSWYFFIVVWGVLYVALSYAAKVRHAERSAALYRSEAQAAQLRALRYQINPHFLFNTLNSLSSLVMAGRNEEAERMILNLANFFRTSLTADASEDVPLADELKLQRLYLDIERSRFPDRLRVVIDSPPELDGVLVPGMILQPLVENAIKHSVARSTRPVTLSIRARIADGELQMRVEDDGEPAGASPPGHGLGLRNVADRLRARFDGAARCRYGRREGGGFAVDLSLPVLRGAAA